MPKTGIICTIGPASRSFSMLRKMMLAGMNIARLNFSHASLEEHGRSIDVIRRLNKVCRSNVGILQDLEGLRIRIGRLPGRKEVALKKKQILFLTNDRKIYAKSIIPFDYDGPLSDIKQGNIIYIDDGNIALIVRKRTSRYIKTEVVTPGILKEHKGINIPAAKLRFKGLTDKDKLDIQFALLHRPDYIAQSFVRDKRDILPIKELIKFRLPDCKIIAKIENRQGIRNIDQIIKVCDGIMIARGDMGVSIPLYEIPVVQKEIIKKCNKAKKFVITATQMLESMTENLRPERAEVTDVANAVLDGSDFVMLSGETAVGKFPVETVQMMNKIIRFTEKWRGK